MTMSSVRELNLQVKEDAIFLKDLLVEINKVMVGQEALVERVLIAGNQLGSEKQWWKSRRYFPV